MFVEGGWKRPVDPPPRRPRLTARQQQVVVWIFAINAVLLLVAPIGGATIIGAIVALLRG